MEDVEFTRSHSHSPLPEAGHDPGDPLRPEIDEENSTPNLPIGDPDQDMEVSERRVEMPDADDVQEGGLSDNESILSELDEQQFEDFDADNIAIEERPAQMIDENTVGLIGVHKRRRTELDGEAPKKKKKRAEKPRRKKTRDEDVSGGDDTGTRKSRRSKKAGRIRGTSPDVEADENLTPEERMYYDIP